MKSLRTIAIAAAILGILDSIYLLIIKVTNNKALCIQGVGDCWSVNTSRYSEVFGIPLSVLGIIAYTVILTLWILLPRNDFFKRNIPIANFMLSLIGVIYSAYLTYLEIAVIKAICPFCVVSAILLVILFVVSLIQLIQGPGDE
ncbi:MAG: vitamin K epoxide reductase family protein [Chloroflexi bacterium]|nr:vitamin K epoxide reductase [Anaerolinea sp.]TDA65015.1 MAG: vitamin K epoxide reductase family protein [Chloroflexota bacterium]